MSTATAPVRRPLALILLACVIAIWGGNWPIMKIALHYIPPVSFAAARMVMGAVLLFLVAAAKGKAQWPTAGDWKIVLTVGLMQMAGFLALIALALQYVPAGRSSILAYTTPLWVVPGAALFLDEKLRGLKLTGFLVGMAGVAVMFNPLAFDWTRPDVLLGNGLLLLGALLWAGQIVQVRAHKWQGSPLTLAPWQFTVAALVLLPLAYLLEGTQPIQWDAPALWAVLAYNGPLATAFGFWAMLTVTRALPAITTSLGSLGVPVVGVVCGVAFLGEDLTVTNIAGLGLIGSGLACVTVADWRAEKRRRHSHERHRDQGHSLTRRQTGERAARQT